MDLKRLADPFHPDEIEWREQSCGTGAKGAWVQVLAYVSNRAIMNRLDEVCGPESWSSEIEITEKGVLCRLGILCNNSGWVWKTDGADFTDIESFKGGISGSMKRAAVHWGIGRYLYNLDASFCQVMPQRGQGAGWHKIDNKKKEVKGFWQEPALPDWARPKGK